jgi:DNA-binding MarR family transcriptional regulator
MKSIDQECAERILNVIPIAMRAIVRQSHQAGDLALTLEELAILDHLQRRGEAHPTALALLLDIPKATVSDMLNRMAEQELILWSRGSERDRRSVRLNLTPQGHRTLESARRRTVAAIAARLIGMDARDKTQLIASLDVLQLAFQSWGCEEVGAAPGT